MFIIIIILLCSIYVWVIIFVHWWLSFVQRKEKMLKKQHREALLLDNMMGVNGLAPGHSLRGRKRVSYTFGKALV